MSEINNLIKEVHQTAIEKGWWEKERPPLEIYALIHSEISEAVEEVRNSKPALHFGISGQGLPKAECIVQNLKPEGELIELADAVIRIFDYCGHKKWDLEEAIKLKMEYNKTRPIRHGNKRY